jgi:uncharacterized membrane protein YqjE
VSTTTGATGHPPEEFRDPTEPAQADRSLGELVGQVTSDIGTLMTTQLELAKVEIKEEVSRAGKGAGMVGAGGLTAYAAVLMLSVALAFGIGDLIDSLGWAFLIVGAIHAAIATVLVMTGKQQITSVTPVAEQTIASVKEDIEWAKQQKS